MITSSPASTSAHDLLWSGWTMERTLGLSVVAYDVEPLGFAGVAIGTASAAVAVLLLVETVLNYGPLYRREAAAVALSTVAPAAGVLLWLFQIGPVPALNLAPTLFLTHVLLDGYAFFESDMFETNPATRRAAERSVIDDIASPIFVVDTEGQVVDANDRATALFGTDRQAVLETPIEEFVALTDDERQRVRIPTDTGVREFVVVTSPLTDPAGTEVGETVVLQDITTERRNEQRLSVLNRVIRHNLRNELTVINGMAEMIGSEADRGEIERWSETIETHGRTLDQISEKARTFERLHDTEPNRRPVRIDRLLATVTDELAERYPAATVTFETECDGRLRTDPERLALAVENLVENALEHNDAPEPYVTIVASVDGDVGTIEIADNGPGIEGNERTPLEDGRVNDLEHATGLGLWTVTWAVETMGGDISVSDTDDGTTVTVRV